MNKWILCLITIVALPSLWANSNDILEENYYQNYRSLISGSKNFKQNKFTAITSFEQSLYVDALWDMLDEGSPEAESALGKTDSLHFEPLEKLRLSLLKLIHKKSNKLETDVEELIINALRSPQVNTKLIYTIAAFEEELLKAGHHRIIELASLFPEYLDIKGPEESKKEISQNMISDLFYYSPDVTTYMNGEYARSVKIFMFCRNNRLYSCLMAMRNAQGEVVRNADGSIWTHKALASSARGLPSYTRNGNTPAGVWTIDSVMPVADQQLSFGKNRRMILNFIPKSKNEVLLKSLLPQSSHNEDWWAPTIVARDIGRNLFRIHGTGRLNNDPNTPYFPFVRTSGCIAQRENKYNRTVYKDQRELLDAIMVAMGHEVKYENEVKIKGILYLVEMDDQNEAVSEDDLHLWGIQ